MIHSQIRMIQFIDSIIQLQRLTVYCIRTLSFSCQGTFPLRSPYRLEAELSSFELQKRNPIWQSYIAWVDISDKGPQSGGISAFHHVTTW